ncbi:serine/threonine-protein phosphatase [Clostridium sporogenes]|uniref:Serine/threonine-protein phosphatase n=1 Tax=Clostridium botulinum TaxID=1491 RepID=A0A6M0T2Q7_CLOBO|nr:SpoIIE family protein phosphatase [Clostridium sporogenes]NFA62086.1 serine/threonine-protein phosphatase [Clostridium botulinum]NFI74975.1 serine/threonine-protein phosphatase [Clostridium sporogenes]NFL73973.1 serine/threonine-protein phosphatase [Clostridium sporogenes]NFM25914.1 serine/threonine-protein phosphatase [Clostridium sporogenes]NFP63102.1 serine/threonine-protein phosphatase [Clostridium sporogenes]
MSLFVEVASHSLNKYGEELCGDMVEVVRLSDCTIIVLADGLGSGVKANILSTLTSKIAATMLKEGANLYDTVDTIVNTLPICKVRNIAYSTFTLIKIYNNGDAYIAEYDSPPIFIIRNNKYLDFPKKEIIIDSKRVLESNIKLKPGDLLTVVSDGVIHAGLGEILNLGWQWENVKDYLERRSYQNMSTQFIAKDLLEVCFDLYDGKPGDDTTVVSVGIKKPVYVDLFTGPPKDKSKDKYVIEQLMKGNGKKVICGGTAANIVQRELNRELKVNLDLINTDLPPTATMEGIDLITEGVLTLSCALDMIKSYSDPFYKLEENKLILKKDAASLLVKVLMECTHLNIWVGSAMNPAHQNPNLPIDLSIKLKLVEELSEYMKNLGKIVTVNSI